MSLNLRCTEQKLAGKKRASSVYKLGKESQDCLNNAEVVISGGVTRVGRISRELHRITS